MSYIIYYIYKFSAFSFSFPWNFYLFTDYNSKNWPDLSTDPVTWLFSFFPAQVWISQHLAASQAKPVIENTRPDHRCNQPNYTNSVIVLLKIFSLLTSLNNKLSSNSLKMQKCHFIPFPLKVRKYIFHC